MCGNEIKKVNNWKEALKNSLVIFTKKVIYYQKHNHSKLNKCFCC